MSTRYYTDISAELVNSSPWWWPDGWRLVQLVDAETRFAEDMQRWLVEDDAADPRLEGFLVDPVVKQHYMTDGFRGPVHVKERIIRNLPGPTG